MKITYWEGELGKKTTFEENYATKKKILNQGMKGCKTQTIQGGGGCTDILWNYTFLSKTEQLGTLSTSCWN